MPTYLPDPNLSPQEIVERVGQFVASSYADLEARLLDVARRRLTPLPELESARLAAIVAIRRESERLVAQINREVAEQILDYAARAGSAATAALIHQVTGETILAAPGPVTALALDLSNRLEVLNQRILRFDQDVYQWLNATIVPDILTGATTSTAAQRRLVTAFLSEGVTGFTDRSGRNWKIGTYAEMAARTAALRAWSDSAVHSMQEAGYNLATVVIGNTACRHCGQYAGQVLSLDGTTGTVSMLHAIEDTIVEVEIVATIDEARANGFQHPNCRCALVPFFPGLDTPGAETTYDPERERALEDLRRHERAVRQAKRDLAAGKGTKRDVRDAQKRLRDHLDRTGLHRQGYREQLWFTDGGPKARRR